MKNKSANIQKQWSVILCLCIIFFASRAYAQCYHLKYASSQCEYPCCCLNKHMCDYHYSKMTESERTECGCPSSTTGTSTGATTGSGVQGAVTNGAYQVGSALGTAFGNWLFKPKQMPATNQDEELQRQKEVTERWQQQWKYQKYTDSVNAAQIKNLQLSKQELEERKLKKQKDCDNMLTMLKAHPEYWAQWKDYMKLNCGMEPPQSQAAVIAQTRLVQNITNRFLQRDTAMESQTKNAIRIFNENAVVINLKESWQGLDGMSAKYLKIEGNVPEMSKEQLEMLKQEREKKTNAFVDWVSKETEKADYAAADFVKQNQDEIKNKVNEIMEEKVVKTMTGGMAESIDDLIPSQFKVIKKTHDDYTKFLGELMPAYLNDLAYGSPEKLADDDIGVNKFGMKVAGIEDYSDKWKPPVKK